MSVAALLFATVVGPPAAVAHFETAVRPLFVRHCQGCHGADPKANKGGLRLTGRTAVLVGGDSGPAAVPGDPAVSLLVRAVRGGELQMPPQGKLSAAEVAAVERWVREGAYWPGGADDGSRRPPRPADVPGGGWAFRPVAPVRPPAGGHPVDAFVADRLRSVGLFPAPPADPRALVRRVTFDLLGLPPTPDEVDAFVRESARDPAGAWAALVERLLASPHYGERWGRHWLDVARYADSNGQDENTAFAHAWRFRDYVVRSFTADKPFDRFVREQVAGDLLPPAADPGERADQLVATGYLAIGPKLLAEPDKQKLLLDVADEQLDTLGKGLLGLSLGCARCHDHKFDPVTAREYYALLGVFTSTRTLQGPGTVAKAFERPVPGGGSALGVEEGSTAAYNTRPRNLCVQVRGNYGTPGEEAPPVFPRALGGGPEFVATGPNFRDRPLANTTRFGRTRAGSGRLQLADWLTDGRHPLTARVWVNRVWGHHFGAGLVRTPDEFGSRGEPPTHPELLDFLAAEFVAGGWSAKRLHRLILSSAAYRRAAGPPPAGDPDNRLLAVFPRRRLEAEAVRDGILSVAGTLDRTVGGSLLRTANFEYVEKDPAGLEPDTPRRTLYLPVVRGRVNGFLQAFDFPDPATPCGRRASTTVAPQALWFLNSPFVQAQSRAFADRLHREAGDDAGRVRRAYRLAFVREPTPAEQGRAERFAAAEGWPALCQALFASNEFVTVE